MEERDGKVYVRLASNLLFASGSTAIDPEGREALVDLAKAIEGETDFEIVVEGHTDDVAFNSSVSPRNNWELSVLRATAVVEVLGWQQSTCARIAHRGWPQPIPSPGSGK